MIANDQELKVTQGEQQRLPPPLAGEGWGGGRSRRLMPLAAGTPPLQRRTETLYARRVHD